MIKFKRLRNVDMWLVGWKVPNQRAPHVESFATEAEARRYAEDKRTDSLKPVVTRFKVDNGWLVEWADILGWFRGKRGDSRTN